MTENPRIDVDNPLWDQTTFTGENILNMISKIVMLSDADC